MRWLYQDLLGQLFTGPGRDCAPTMVPWKTSDRGCLVDSTALEVIQKKDTTPQAALCGTIDGFLTSVVSLHPAALGLKLAAKQGRRSVSYLQLEISSETWMELLVKQPAKNQIQRVAVSVKPCVQLPGILFGILKAGAIYVPVPPEWSDSYIQEVFNLVEPSFVICDEVRRFSSLCPEISVLEAHPKSSLHTRDSEALLSEASRLKRPNHSSVNPAVILMENLKKVSQFSHHMVLSQIRTSWEILPVEYDEINLAKAPHLNSTESLLEWTSGLLSTNPVVIVPEPLCYEPEALLESVRDLPVRRLWLHPNTLLLMCNSLDRRKIRFTSDLKLILITTQKIPLDIAVLFFRVFSDVKFAVWQNFSDTEVSRWNVYEDQISLLKAVYENTLPPSILLRSFDLSLDGGKQISVRKDTSGGTYISCKASQGEKGYLLAKTEEKWIRYDVAGPVDLKDFLLCFMNISPSPSQEVPSKKTKVPVSKHTPQSYKFEDFSRENEEEFVRFLILTTLHAMSTSDAPVPSIPDLTEFCRVLLRGATPKKLVFGGRNQDGKLVAVNVAYDPCLVDRSFLNLVCSEENPQHRVVTWTLFPLTHQLVENPGVTVESYMMSVDFSLERHNRFYLCCEVDGELAQRALELGYENIITKNYDSFSKSIARANGYERRASFQLNRLLLPNGDAPFVHHPSNSRLTLNIRTLFLPGTPDGRKDSNSSVNHV